MKISPEFAARLDRRKPGDIVRAVLLLETEPAATKGVGRRALKSRRKELAEARRRTVEAARKDVAKALKAYQGHVLTEGDLGTLGGLTVETTVAGIWALAESPRIKAIVEDQPVSRVGEPGRRASRLKPSPSTPLD